VGDPAGTKPLKRRPTGCMQKIEKPFSKREGLFWGMFYSYNGRGYS